MGMPSMGIYSYELFKFFDVDNIIRIGTAGAVSEKLGLRDIVLAMSSCTNSNFASQYGLNGAVAPTASFELLKKAYEQAEKLNKKVYVGSVYTTDLFYDDSDRLADWRKLGILATEMESAALYLNAARLDKNALCICTISDCPLTGESCSSDEREKTFNDMIQIALSMCE
jgi:purine-nucleoside phosphorylase